MIFMIWQFIGARTAFVDDGEIGVIEPFGQRPRTHHTTDVRRYHHHVRAILTPGITQQHRRGVHVVDRHREEALNLVGMQVDGEYTRLMPAAPIMLAINCAVIGTRAARGRRS